MKKLLLAAAVFFAVFTLVGFAEDNSWVGTWKLDMAKSHFEGYTFTYTKTPDGMYHYSEGPAATTTSFRIDGKEYPTGGGHSSTWTAVGDNAWDTIHKSNGVQISKTHRELSADGKTFTMISDGTQPDGKTFQDTAIFTRVTGSKGLLGKWKSTKMNITDTDTLVILPSLPGMYHAEDPGYKASLEGKMDGSDIKPVGPTVGPGEAVTLKAVSAHKVLYSYKEDGKIVTKGMRTLAEDGKTFTDVSWTPGKESEKAIGFYVKQ